MPSSLAEGSSRSQSAPGDRDDHRVEVRPEQTKHRKLVASAEVTSAGEHRLFRRAPAETLFVKERAEYRGQNVTVVALDV